MTEEATAKVSREPGKCLIDFGTDLYVVWVPVVRAILCSKIANYGNTKKCRLKL